MDAKIDKPKKDSRSITITLNRNFFLVVVVIAALVGAFFLGSAYGGNKQKHQTSRLLPNTAATDTALANRWTSVGTVSAVSDSEITVKDARGQEKKAAITKDTEVTSRKGDALTVKDLKTAQQVIVSGQKDGDKPTATRIRLQQ